MANILVIDDNPSVRRLVQRILLAMGHTVRQAESGRDGLALFRQREPDLVITDIVMADGEGIETIREIRQISKGADPSASTPRCKSRSGALR